MNDVTDDINTNLRPSLLYDGMDRVSLNFTKAIVHHILIHTFHILQRDAVIMMLCLLYTYYLHLAKQSFARCTRNGNVKEKEKMSHILTKFGAIYLYEGAI